MISNYEFHGDEQEYDDHTQLQNDEHYYSDDYENEEYGHC